VFIQDSFVVIQSRPERISKIVRFIKTWRFSAHQRTHFVGRTTQQIKRIALDERAGETATWMSHDRGIARVRIYFDGFNVHFVILSRPLLNFRSE
jgi:hypothetical protein